MKKSAFIFLAVWVGAAACLFIPGPVTAQDKDYPNQPITLIVPWGAGGGTDIVVRSLAASME